MKEKAPIAVALDVPTLSKAVAIARDVTSEVQYVKVGLESYLRDGRDGLGEVMSACQPGTKLFLDLKLHDIPNTVAGAARSVAPIAPALFTVHACGGAAMIAAAVEALPETRIAAVTLLTSLGADDLAALGVDGTPIDAVCRWAKLAVDAGAQAIVCSPLEVAAVRSVVTSDTMLVTPGVRPESEGHGDQRRTATPQAAISDGSDLLVIGRPITGASSPRSAAEAIASQL